MMFLLDYIKSFFHDLIETFHKGKLFAYLSKEGNPDFNTEDSHGWSPISRVIELENVEILKLVIYKSKGADLNLPSCSQMTPLTCAIFMENLKICEELINSGANVNQEDDIGWTPLIVAIDRCNCEIILFLSTREANFNLIDSDGWTPLTYAMHKENMEIVELLVENGADMNDHCGSSWNAFYFAISENNMEMVKFFMENGAESTIQTRFLQYNINSFELAMKKDQMNILKQLVHYSEE